MGPRRRVAAGDSFRRDVLLRNAESVASQVGWQQAWHVRAGRPYQLDSDPTAQATATDYMWGGQVVRRYIDPAAIVQPPIPLVPQSIVPPPPNTMGARGTLGPATGTQTDFDGGLVAPGDGGEGASTLGQLARTGMTAVGQVMANGAVKAITGVAGAVGQAAGTAVGSAVGSAVGAGVGALGAAAGTAFRGMGGGTPADDEEEEETAASPSGGSASASSPASIAARPTGVVEPHGNTGMMPSGPGVAGAMPPGQVDGAQPDGDDQVVPDMDDAGAQAVRDARHAMDMERAYAAQGKPPTFVTFPDSAARGNGMWSPEPEDEPAPYNGESSGSSSSGSSAPNMGAAAQAATASGEATAGIRDQMVQWMQDNFYGRGSRSTREAFDLQVQRLRQRHTVLRDMPTIPRSRTAQGWARMAEWLSNVAAHPAAREIVLGIMGLTAQRAAGRMMGGGVSGGSGPSGQLG